MKALILAGSCLIAFAAPAFAQNSTMPSATDTAPTAPTTTIERGDTTQQTTATTTTTHAKHTHRHAVASQHSGANLSTEVRPRAATVMPAPGSSALGNRSDDTAGPTTVITR